MREDVWRNTWAILNSVSPTVRVDFALCGEPTLHPELIGFIKIARETAPRAQIQITTNGTQLLRGAVRYRDMIDAGANVVYTDMYGSKERYLQLAQESGVPWYEYYNKPPSAPSPWTYYGPGIKMVVLQEQPEQWPESRLRAGLLGTWFNNLDWRAAERFGLRPVVTPPARRCNQPFIYVTVNYAGSYLLCCQDGMGETAGLFGSVTDGVPGFHRYWYGEEMQLIRRRLRSKNRADTSYCARCAITFSRCDYLHWTEDEINRHWDGFAWQMLPPEEPGLRRFMK